MADTRFPSFLRIGGSSSPPAANPQVERMIGVSDPYRHVQVEHRVSWAVRPAFVPRTTTTRHDGTCREGRPGRVGCRLLRLPPPPRSPAKLRAIRLGGARPCSPGHSTLRP